MSEAVGALLLFATNVAAIIATGKFVLLAFRVRSVLAASGRPLPTMSRKTLAVVAGTVLIVAIPLSWGTVLSAREQSVVSQAQPVAERWADEQGWLSTDVSFRQGELQIQALGSLPEADAEELRADLNAAGLAKVDTRVTLVVGGSKEFPAT